MHPLCVTTKLLLNLRILAYISEVIIGKVLWWPFVLLIDLVQINQINSNGHCVTEEVDFRRDTTESWRGIEVFVPLPLQANEQCLVELYIKITYCAQAIRYLKNRTIGKINIHINSNNARYYDRTRGILIHPNQTR